MSTLYGHEYETEIDEICRLVEQHLEKFMDKDAFGVHERIMGAVASGYAYYFMHREKTKP